MSDRYPSGTTMACLIVAALCLLSFHPIWQNTFVSWDDPAYVTDNPYVKSGLTLEGVRWAFTDTSLGMRIPVTWLSLMLDAQLYGIRYPGFALTNLLLHTATCILVFLLLFRTTSAWAPALMVAVLFAVHPLRVESVVWITERKDMLYGLFWFLAILAYVRFVRGESRRWYAMSLVLFLLSCLSKPMAVTLPAALLLLDYWPLGRLREHAGNSARALGRLVVEKVPYFLVAAPMALDTYYAHHGTGKPGDEWTWYQLAANSLVSHVAYIRKLFLPLDLAAFYPFRESVPVWQALAALAFLVGVTIAAWLLRKRLPFLLMGWLWYLATLFPVNGLAQAGVQGMADRFTYIPLLGLLVMLCYGLWSAVESSRAGRRALVGAFSLATACLVVLTVVQTGYWKNDYMLFSRSARVTDENYLAHHKLGYMAMEHGDLDVAKKHFEKLMEMAPKNAMSPYLMAQWNLRAGDREAAEQFFLRALALAPGWAAAHVNYANMLARQGRFAEAEPYYRRAIELDPDHPGWYRNLGMVLKQLGKNEQSEEFFRIAREKRSEEEGAPSLARWREMLEREGQ
ncbi:MAG: tetratricopeptide repeat protein [Desulfatibacillaceae bacterium]